MIDEYELRMRRHDIEANDHMMSAGGITPWHNLGTVVDGEVRSSAQAIELAKLGWTVSLAPLYASVRGELALTDHASREDLLPAEMGRAVVRDDTRKVLGLVGTGFRVLQNAAAFKAFDPWVQAGILTYETAGSMRDGARVWILAKLAPIEPIEVGKGDVVNPYVLLAHGHDGSLAVRVKPTAVRVVCRNTLRLSLADGAIGRRFQHRGDVATKAADAVASIEEIRTAMALQASAYKSLTSVGPTNDDATLDYLAAVFQESAKDMQEGRKAARIFGLFSGEGMGSDLATANGTYWGLYQAVSEYVSHHAGGGNGSKLAKRTESAVWGPADDVLRRGLSVAYVMGHGLAGALDTAEMPSSKLDEIMAAHVRQRAA